MWGVACPVCGSRWPKENKKHSSRWGEKNGSGRQARPQCIAQLGKQCLENAVQSRPGQARLYVRWRGRLGFGVHHSIIYCVVVGRLVHSPRAFPPVVVVLRRGRLCGCIIAVHKRRSDNALWCRIGWCAQRPSEDTLLWMETLVTDQWCWCVSISSCFAGHCVGLWWAGGGKLTDAWWSFV